MWAVLSGTTQFLTSLSKADSPTSPVHVLPVHLSFPIIVTLFWIDVCYIHRSLINVFETDIILVAHLAANTTVVEDDATFSERGLDSAVRVLVSCFSKNSACLFVV